MRDIEKKIVELQDETRDCSAEELVADVWERFSGKIALSSSLGVEDQVLTDMVVRVTKEPRVFTLDTGRLPQETYDVLQETRSRYGIDIKVAFPDYQAVEEMVNAHGPNLFYDSVELRKRCCHVRKIEPLKRELAGLEAWIVGLRAEQAVTRSSLERFTWDDQFGLIKIAPLADWSEEQVWNYVKQHDVPTNALHQQGYPSIGCAPCTRAIRAGEDVRAGRWWWEEPEHKECGLHVRADGTLGPKE